MAERSSIRVRFNIDRGGTFTDIYAEVLGENGPGYRVHKLLSESDSYENAPREGIRRLLSDVLGEEIPRDSPVPTKHIEWIRMGTTVATNALLERNAERDKAGNASVPRRVALVTTKGFKDLLQIGNQSRPDIFDLTCAKPELLYDHAHVVEVDERVRVRNDLSAALVGAMDSAQRDKERLRICPNGEVVQILRPLPRKGSEEYGRLCEALKRPLEAGVKCAAIVCLHAYAFGEHELELAQLCKELGYEHVSPSHALTPSVRAVARGHTATVDAFLTPFLATYIAGFLSGFDKGIENVPVLFMQSDGGLVPVDHFRGHVALLSGPAGGVVGYSQTTGLPEPVPPLVGLDMGGTSTDVSRVHGKHMEVNSESELDGVFVQATQLAIHTVAAGGGSVLQFDPATRTLDVGPDSVGSKPGPISYGHGGKRLAVTDANVVLGRVVSQCFPFKLHVSDATAAMEERAQQINASRSGSLPPLSVPDVAHGYIELAVARMASAIRTITEAKGHDVGEHLLAVFGGAGPQHACALGASLGLDRVLVHRYGSVLSALGLGLADEHAEVQEPCAVDTFLNEKSRPALVEKMEALAVKAHKSLKNRGYADEQVSVDRFMLLRYEGTDTALTVRHSADANEAELLAKEFKREFGFALAHTTRIVVDSFRVVGRAHAPHIAARPIEKASSESPIPTPVETMKVWFKVNEKMCELDTPMYRLSDLLAEQAVDGPALIIDMAYYVTTVLEPNWRATVTTLGHLLITRQVRSPTAQHAVEEVVEEEELDDDSTASEEGKLVLLSLYAHRFMAIAEQMGVALQRTAKSVNIKERLDFSCALFNHTGGLVANAPHLPVHLGAMQHAVKHQIELIGDKWAPGEVVLSNHPAAGGSHLPDFTVITPVHVPEHLRPKRPMSIAGKQVDLTRPLFYVASRAHHAEIGGIAPGSMPALSTRLVHEGAATKSLVIAREGKFEYEAVREFLASPGKATFAPHERKSMPSRRPDDNIADLQAQIAANNRGTGLVLEMMDKRGVREVLSMMRLVQRAAERAVRAALCKVAKEALRSGCERSEDGRVVLRARDYLDGGQRISVSIAIDDSKGDALVDFAGTSNEVWGNLNAPPSVTTSAVLYALRCIVKDAIPLNDGCLAPVTLRIPPLSLLSPSEDAAVVGGNVLTSQRITDVILMAFRAAANSQGCMNNLSFGSDDGSVAYYETIAGGAGAGPTWVGQSAVQTHMTNTRITDAEVIERRFPVLLRQFSIRRGSGGVGKHRGGHGVIRIIQFLVPLTVSILSERRSLAPNGLDGGGPGKRGRNVLVRRYGTPEAQYISLGGRNTVKLDAGDAIGIFSPGGGAYGPAEDDSGYTSNDESDDELREADELRLF